MKDFQSGNALIFILIAIVLLGGLTMLLSRSGSQTEDTGAIEGLTIQATNTLKYASAIEATVQTLLTRGCSESQLSFQNTNPLSEDYSNPNAPANESCHVFSPKGGAQTYKVLPAGLYTTSGNGLPLFFAGHSITANAGTTQSDLGLFFNNITKDFCMALNRTLGISNPSADAPVETTDSVAGTYFKGGFGGVVTDPIGNNAALTGKRSGCMKRSDQGNMYQFYQILIAK